MKYLIVEDDFIDVRLLRYHLENIGYEVTVLYPDDATEWNQQNQPEVVQLDGLGGLCFELYKKLKKDNPKANFILFSARKELHSKANKMGMKVFDKGSGGEYLEKYVTELFEKKSG